MSDDDRASRLRSRRGRARQRVEEQQQAAEAAEAADAERAEQSEASASGTETDESTETVDEAAETEDESDDNGESGSVKTERVGTYMYLPESQKRELERVYGTLKVQYEYEFDEEFEKNRHFFPAVVRHGLDTLDGMDAEAVRTLVEDL